MKLVSENVWTWLTGYQRGVLDPVCSYFKSGAWHSKLYKKGLWDGRVRFVRYHPSARKYYFPTGLLDRVVDYLRQEGVPFVVDDRRTSEAADPVYELHDDKVGIVYLDRGKYRFQGEALETFLSYGRGILKCATGAGKTVVGAAAIKSIGQPAVWFTHRRNLLYQTQRVLRERLQVPVGIIGDGNTQYEDVTVAMVQSCSKRAHDDFLQTRKVLVADEVHHLADSKTWFDNAAAVPAVWRLGLSATPDIEGPGMALHALVGPVIYEISAEELISRGVLVQPRIWWVEQQHPKLDDKLSWPDVYNAGVVDNPHRNKAVLSVVKTLANDGKPTLVLVHRIAHGKVLTAMLETDGVPAGFVQGSVKEEKRQKMLDDLWSGKLGAIVAVASTLGEGTDLPKLKAIVNATGTRGGGDATSEYETGRATIQILGRGLRSAPGKTYVDYVDFADGTHRMLSTASLARLSTLEAEGYGGHIEHWRDYKV